jgi:hypothetical protein
MASSLGLMRTAVRVNRFGGASYFTLSSNYLTSQGGVHMRYCQKWDLTVRMNRAAISSIIMCIPSCLKFAISAKIQWMLQRRSSPPVQEEKQRKARYRQKIIRFLHPCQQTQSRCSWSLFPRSYGPPQAHYPPLLSPDFPGSPRSCGEPLDGYGYGSYGWAQSSKWWNINPLDCLETF